jgi:hypothetical protein
MSNAIAGEALLSGASVAPARRWIESARFDLIFFTLSPLLALPIAIGMENGIKRALIIGVVLAFPHYFSSLAFYFWDERRDYYRRRWLAFYAGPVILGITYAALLYTGVPIVIQFVLFFWNTFHVARQNCGILSIYRHSTGVHDVKHRNAANFAIISICTWLALWNIGTHPQVYPAFIKLHPEAPLVIFFAAGAVALFGLLRLGVSLTQRIRNGQSPALPEALFLVTSILFFHPYIWMKDSSMATGAMLLPHYFQYMGIVWMLHRRKFGTATAATPSRSQSVLATLSRSALLLVPVLFAIGAAFFVGARLSARFGLFPHFESLYLFIAFQHFYMDGLFWAFRRPEIRSSLSPYLMRRPQPALAT